MVGTIYVGSMQSCVLMPSLQNDSKLPLTALLRYRTAMISVFELFYFQSVCF